jgi:hypothetical protein
MTTNPSTSTTTPTPQPFPHLAPGIGDAIVTVREAAVDVRTNAHAAEHPGLARRLHKLARQLDAATRLLARGTGLDAPPALGSLHWLAGEAATANDLDRVDRQTHSAALAVVRLHKWRGHTACIPAEDRH